MLQPEMLLSGRKVVMAHSASWYGDVGPPALLYMLSGSLSVCTFFIVCTPYGMSVCL